MLSKRNLSFIKISLVLAVIPAVIYGYASGPPPEVAGNPQDPGGQTCSQAGCHTGTAVNVAGAGSVTINAGGSTYTPGKTQQVTVTIADSKQRVWGFELTARTQSNNAQAGNLVPTDASTWVQCTDGSPRSTSGCPARFSTQFIQHTQPKSGAGSGTFTFNWTPPATASGNVVMYVAGNAANGDGNNTGDHIYTSSITLTPAASLATTTTTLTSSANPVAFGQQKIVLTATVAPAASTGTVTFNDGTTSLGTATLSNGIATLELHCFAFGTHSITAVYSGDSKNAGSTSSFLVEIVNTATTAPVIEAGAVVPIYSTSSTIQSGSWISIFGCQFSPGVTVWNSDFPTNLGGTSVKINNKAGYIWFVSPTQINVQVPDDTAIGPVQVSVTGANGTSNSVTANLAASAPSFVLFDATHAAGVLLTPDGSGAYDASGNLAPAGKGVYDLLGPKGAFAFNTRAAKKGETVELFGVGFGPTQSPAPAGKVLAAVSQITSPISATLGGINAPIVAYIVAAGEYQINVTIPANTPVGDQPLVVTVGGVQPAQTVVIPVQ